MVVIFSVAVLPTGFMESQSYFNCGIVVSPLNAFDQIDVKTIRMSLGKRIAFSK